MNQTPAPTEAVLVECDLPDPPDKVWRALTEPDLLGRWLMPNDIRPEAGAKFSFQPVGAGQSTGAAQPAGTPVECEILESDPGRKLQWRQREQRDLAAPSRFVESVVTFELTGIPGGGTHLRVVHDGFRSGLTGAANRIVSARYLRGANKRTVSAFYPLVGLRNAA